MPERPARAGDVHLRGQMQGTGFTEHQWLVERQGRFLQLTGLLYRILELADGRRTSAEIAEELTESTEWLVTPADVRHLLQTKLVPAGLVLPKDGVVATSTRPTASALGAPLRVNARTKLIGPGALDAIAKRLQVLFAPPILIPMLLLIAAAHAWLYVRHGVLAALIDALYTPAALLVILVAIVAAALVHEFGHAAALRYGGGRARRIGGGFYTVFPAFYTDVTESYRLGRWARVRTGLGGVYFHLIFAVGLIGLARVTGQEYLLLAVMLITIEVARQFIPFLRLDGYWVLADLAGIPDFFSQMGPFLRSLSPVPVEGSRLPALKGWAKATFLAYILLTIPVLGLLLYLLVKSVPHIITVAYDGLTNQASLFSDARRTGDVLGMATAAAQILMLALPIAGVVYFFYALAWRPISAMWHEGAHRPVRRMASVVAAVGVVAGIWFVWVPQLPFVGRPVPVGVKKFTVTDRRHVQTSVAYPQDPPVGGAHAPVPQTCGFYERPVRKENAVHSLEHGAVWITYRRATPEQQLDALRNLVHERTYVLVSPYPNLPAPVVASAWGRQLRLDSARDPRLKQFVAAYRLGSQAPESGAPCRGVGKPR